MALPKNISKEAEKEVQDIVKLLGNPSISAHCFFDCIVGVYSVNIYVDEELFWWWDSYTSPRECLLQIYKTLWKEFKNEFPKFDVPEFHSMNELKMKMELRGN